MGHYCGPATISDGVSESLHDVEIHTMPAQRATAAAWHVVIAGRLPHELRIPNGKTLSVLLENGAKGVGTLVDPQVIRGAGDPPVGEALSQSATVEGT